ncbi:MAG: carboxypeptidase M32 [Candidatus Micrarchaeota archaeon]|nr:carboxypeptidase M32 [Candidatus Micrarchaeota archaeon]
MSLTKVVEGGKLHRVLQEYRYVNAIEEAENVDYWDQRTYMHKDAITPRSEMTGYMDALWHREMLRLAPDIKYLKGHNRLEKGILKEFRAQLAFVKNVPIELVKQKGTLSSRATVIWETAKKKNDFKSFAPHLKRLVDIQMEYAEAYGYKSNRYDALIDYFEYGMTTREMDGIFQRLLPELKRIREKTDMPSEHPLEKMRYKKAQMKKVNLAIQNLFGVSKNAIRTDKSAHPMMVPIDSRDIRITTNFPPTDFRIAIDNNTHELGHAIYGFQISPRIRYTPADGSASFGVDESQSRFFENILGHSMSFAKVIAPLLKEHLGVIEPPEETYRYFNMLKKGAVVRVAANELDYDFHIAMRYEIEKGLISGKLQVSELPQIWEEHMIKYIGVKPSNDREGVLQDSHWADAAMGYFPTYTLGNIISGMVWKKMESLDEWIEEKRFDLIREWLGKNIHQHGSLYDPKDLLQKVFRKGYNPSNYIEYLENKYLS